MNNLQKQRIEYMRGKGDSYAAIAAALDISQNTVKSYCRRNNLGAEFIAKQAVTTEGVCDCCNKPLVHVKGKKRKRFCSDKCRMEWWKAHPESLNRKAVYSFICATCGSPFESYGNANRKYCSRACFGASGRASL